MFDKTIRVTGIHATYWKDLSSVLGENPGPNPRGKFKLFNRYMDGFFVAPLLGCLYNRKGNPNLGNSEDEAAMQANIIIKNAQVLYTLLRTIILVDPSSNLSKEDRIEKAFRGESDPEVEAENMKTYMDYFLGGLEILHEEFQDSITDDDFVNKIFEMVNKFYKDINIDKIDEEIME